VGCEEPLQSWMNVRIVTRDVKTQGLGLGGTLGGAHGDNPTSMTGPGCNRPHVECFPNRKLTRVKCNMRGGSKVGKE
jgi:hypothetical protein